MERLDCVVIGGGVIGLAIAQKLATAGREVVLLEAEQALGSHASSRNSEVIHAGIYYPTGSRKARLCVRGKAALYAYCAAHEVPHRRIGKIIVAVREEEIPALERYKAQAEANGVTDLAWLDGSEVRALEPSVRATRGLLSPSTGIVDSHALMGALKRDALAHGADIVLASPVLGGELHDDGIDLAIGGADAMTVRCRTVVNSAGLFAQNVARMLRGLDPSSIPGQYFARGHYFALAGRSPFARLVYPVAVAGGLGIHVTLDMAGQARFGPDVAWVPGVDYSFDESRTDSFYAAIRTYFPALADGVLVPGYVGVRPKLGPAGAAARDFVIQGPNDHGAPGLVNLYGIESPGLTACLAIADEVAALAAQA
jgi:L-2-hydroxyglutarate oxidase LhgO